MFEEDEFNKDLKRAHVLLAKRAKERPIEEQIGFSQEKDQQERLADIRRRIEILEKKRNKKG